MVNITINGTPVSVENGTTILEATRLVGMSVPTLCYLKGINQIGACRVCLVEVKNIDRLLPACDTLCEEGMEVLTNTPKVREARQMNLELLLSQHRINCPVCERNGSCQLQEVMSSYPIGDIMNFKHEYPEDDWDQSLPIIRDESKCIRCYRCVSVCEKVQGLNIWDMVGSGSRTTVNVSHNRKLSAADCAFCGQCITHCPTNALHSRDDSKAITGVGGVLDDPNKITVVQVAPAIRAAWGESFGLDASVATEGRLAAALRRIGFDYVFDTNFSADLTIMEEGNEFLERMQHPEAHKWPMFTSCCPGWVRFLKSNYPDMTDQLSTAKSPQQMFGAVTKTYFAKKIGVDPHDIVCVSIMPCTAKKAELAIPSINDAVEGERDVDFSLTTRELCRMIKADNIDVAALPEEEFDSPLGTGTGAAVIFGTTGGVMEAALRTCYYVLTGENPNADETFKAVRAMDSTRPWVEAEYNVAGIKVRAAVANGLGNARRLIRAIRRGEVDYQFVEIMACPGGCVGGGGQPIHYNQELASSRAKVLYNYDKKNVLRFSHENPEVQALYSEYLGTPCGEIAHHLLHTNHHGWEMPKSPNLDEDVVL
ncbi:MAG: [Firmicutes bacterium]|nr:[FeFe] hydrogenase, group A [Bacillota bacterium]